MWLYSCSLAKYVIPQGVLNGPGDFFCIGDLSLALTGVGAGFLGIGNGCSSNLRFWSNFRSIWGDCGTGMDGVMGCTDEGRGSGFVKEANVGECGLLGVAAIIPCRGGLAGLWLHSDESIKGGKAGFEPIPSLPYPFWEFPSVENG